MGLFTILLGGDVKPTERLKKQVANSYVIAADSGISHAKKLNIQPNIWVGDFDSCRLSDKNEYKELETIEYNTNKDKTDGQLAIETAIERGATKLILCGAFGGDRFDHSLAHIAMALKLANQNIEVILTTGTDEALFLVANKVATPDWEKDICFSIIAFSALEGLKIKNAKWELDGTTPIPFGSTHTISNIVTGQLQIELSSGQGMVVTKI